MMKTENSNDGMDVSNIEGLNKREREHSGEVSPTLTTPEKKRKENGYDSGSPILSKPEKKRKEDGNDSDETLTPSGEEDEGEREKASEGEGKKNDGSQ